MWEQRIYMSSKKYEISQVVSSQLNFLEPALSQSKINNLNRYDSKTYYNK